MKITDALNTYHMTVKNEEVAAYPDWIKTIQHVLYTGGNEVLLKSHPLWVTSVYAELKKDLK